MNLDQVMTGLATRVPELAVFAGILWMIVKRFLEHIEHQSKNMISAVERIEDGHNSIMDLLRKEIAVNTEATNTLAKVVQNCPIGPARPSGRSAEGGL